jgi:hypothetical protein
MYNLSRHLYARGWNRICSLKLIFSLYVLYTREKQLKFLFVSLYFAIFLFFFYSHDLIYHSSDEIKKIVKRSTGQIFFVLLFFIRVAGLCRLDSLLKSCVRGYTEETSLTVWTHAQKHLHPKSLYPRLSSADAQREEGSKKNEWFFLWRLKPSPGSLPSVRGCNLFGWDAGHLLLIMARTGNNSASPFHFVIVRT